MKKVRGEGFCSLFQEIKGEDKFINYSINFLCKLSSYILQVANVKIFAN